MDGLIYVVGGGDGKDWLCSAEVHTPTHYWSPRSIPWKCQNTWILKVYDPKKNVWRSIADLSAKRWKCGLGITYLKGSGRCAFQHDSSLLVHPVQCTVYIHVVCVDCFSGAWRVFICSRWNGLSSCWILGRSSQYWSLYINHHIIFYIQHCDCFDIAVERYCPRTNEWQTVAPMHESRSVVIVIVSGDLSDLSAYFVTFVWITNYHHRHHHIHHHLTGLVVPLLPTRVAFMWAEASARTR